MPLTIFANQHHAAGNAPDTNPINLDFNPPALRLDFAIFDNSALVSYSSNGLQFTTEREFPAGVLSSIDMQVRVLRVRNKTVASVARYDATGYYDPVEIVGRDYVRPA
jgi:hypothetical protein